MDRKLRLSRTNKFFAGVCGGLGEFFKVDPTLIRILFAVVAFLSYFVPAVIIYIVLWAIIPLE